jgi:CBS domain-containing protein
MATTAEAGFDLAQGARFSVRQIGADLLMEAEMIAKDVMSDGVMSIMVNATALEAAELLVNTGVSAMTVVDDDGTVVGIVSEADLIGKPGFDLAQRMIDDTAAGPDRLKRLTVAEVMTRDVITVDEKQSLDEVADVMIKRGVKRLPVMRDGAIVGVVSRVDLLKGMISQAVSGNARRASAPRSAPKGDETVRQAVFGAIQGQPWSRARRTDVVVRDGIVHLWGVAPDPTVSTAYGLAAALVPGVKGVNNHMHVPC